MEVTVHKEHRLGSSSVVLIALILANCAKAPPPGADLGGLGQFKTCVTSVIDKPEYAAVRVHTLDLDTMQPAPAELADETIPTAEDARLFAVRFDEVNPCREEFLKAIAIPRPNWASVVAADLEWTAGIIPFHQPDMAQLRAAAARSHYQ